MAHTSSPLIVLSGTTASGKNRVALSLARTLDAEVLSLDSMKVYRGMDIGTDKPDAAWRAQVPHHLVDVLDPSATMNLSRFVQDADEALGGIRSRGRQPIAVGGTALYLKGFLHGVLSGPAADASFRRGLKAEARVMGTSSLHERLLRIDPEAAERIHPNDYRRIERALEVYALTGRPISVLQEQWKGQARVAHRLYILVWPRALMDERIDRRVDAMFARGFVEEVQALLASGPLGPTAAQALGYREVIGHLRGEMTLSETVEAIKRNTRRFARKQLTWFRKMEGARWIEPQPDEEPERLADRILRDYRDWR